LHDTVRRYAVPRRYLDDALDGVAMDLGPVTFATFDELYRYCYRVASVVGLACIHIWGFQGELAKQHAEAAGIAFQLTNILRDLGEDADADESTCRKKTSTASATPWSNSDGTSGMRRSVTSCDFR